MIAGEDDHEEQEMITGNGHDLAGIGMIAWEEDVSARSRT
jgi:hypothetical protein